jgi:hypothetical protein
MKRHEFITLVGGAAIAWPLDALAQHAGNVWRMGFIAHGHESFYDPLFEGLREYGYEEIVEKRQSVPCAMILLGVDFGDAASPFALA